MQNPTTRILAKMGLAAGACICSLVMWSAIYPSFILICLTACVMYAAGHWLFPGLRRGSSATAPEHNTVVPPPIASGPAQLAASVPAGPAGAVLSLEEVRAAREQSRGQHAPGCDQVHALRQTCNERAPRRAS
jgi:hypothetical protein